MLVYEPGASLVRRRRGDVAVCEVDAARTRGDDARDRLKQGRFPRPRRPDSDTVARRRNAERHVAELELSQSGGQLPDVDHVGAGPVRSYRNARRTVSGMSASTAIHSSDR